MLPFNKYANGLRRLDENELENTRINLSERWHGGFSAAQSRLRRGAKSMRKASLRVKSSRHMKLS